MRRFVTLTLLIALLAACGSPASRADAAPPAPTVVLATANGVEGVSAATGMVRYRVPDGVTTADGGTVMATEGDQLVARNARTGAVRQRVLVGVGYVVAAVSPGGLLVALSTTKPTTYLPVGQEKTDLVVVHMAGPTVRYYHLSGNVAPDGFSDSGNLYLVSYLPPERPDRYQITSLDLEGGTLTGVFGWQKEVLEDMRGQAGTRVFAPDGTALYTLYLRPPATSGLATDDLRAEVHTLKLDAGWAHCVDLPAAFGGHDLSGSSLAASPDGSRLYVVDRDQRQLVEIDTNALTITRTVAIALSSTAAPTSLVAAQDGSLYVSDGPSVVVMDSTTLLVTKRWPVGGPVTGLVANGNTVLASRPGHVDTFTAGRGLTGSLTVPADATAVTRLLT